MDGAKQKRQKLRKGRARGRVLRAFYADLAKKKAAGAASAKPFWENQGGLFLFVFAIGFFAVGGGQHDADKVCGDGQAKQQAAGEIRKRAVGAVCKKDIRQIQHIAQDDEGKGGF